MKKFNVENTNQIMPGAAQAGMAVARTTQPTANVDSALNEMVAMVRQGGSKTTSDKFVTAVDSAVRSCLANGDFTAANLLEAIPNVKVLALRDTETILATGESNTKDAVLRARFDAAGPHQSKMKAMPNYMRVMAAISARLLAAGENPEKALTASSFLRCSAIAPVLRAVFEETYADVKASQGKWVQTRALWNGISLQEGMGLVNNKMQPFIYSLDVWKKEKKVRLLKAGQMMANGQTALVDHWIPTAEFLKTMTECPDFTESQLSDDTTKTNPKACVIYTNVFDVRKLLQCPEHKQHKKDATGQSIQKTVLKIMVAIMESTGVPEHIHKGQATISGKAASKGPFCVKYYLALGMISASHRALVAPFVTRGGADTSNAFTFEV
jgi:hypothetical protein